MTEKELLDIERNYSESKIQHTCVMWFRRTFTDIAELLFSVPNGGWRGSRAGAIMNYEGQIKGVSDLILLECTSHPPLCVEMKIPARKGSSAGRISPEQKAWGEAVRKHGCRYEVCHGLVEFIRVISDHLSLDADELISKALKKYPLYI